MKWNEISADWAGFVPAMMEQWPEAEEDDLLALDGTPGALAGYLAEATGRDRGDVADEISEWAEGAVPSDIRMDEAHDNDAIRDSGRYVPPGEDVYDDDGAFGDDNEAEPPVGRT